ncbi:three component ABC system middle component [Cryobacterium sp. Y29]|uniref:three component ABC system middle component n=1 Tax=Cryobacterium sp. Y29 TaxID=2048285 RepID=UPI00351A39AE
MNGGIAAWPRRPQPASDILNPAISAVCVAWCTARFERDTGTVLPWSLAFLVAPLTLHAPTRARFPRSLATHFPSWVNDNADVLAGFPARAKSFAPYVREGLRFGLRTGLLSLEPDAGLHATIAEHTKVAPHTELRSIAVASALTGGWFARSGSPANIFTQLGVRP